jgi:hypothetical protein
LEMASKGFCHLVGQGIHNKARAISNQLSWKYDKICTASHTFVHVLSSLCHLYPFPVTWRVTIVNFQKIPFLVHSSQLYSLEK